MMFDQISAAALETANVRRRRLAALLLFAYCANPLVANAQVIINGGTPNDGRRAYVDQTQSGLPKINIAKPNTAGVSHNTYQQFNVGNDGLILNNGATNSNTTLAGWVEGNPNLLPGSEAKLILNEVVGGNPSQLKGYLEVAGKKADVIVANESGINCDGCGFINTDRATLTTGKPLFGADGRLDSLAVRQGVLTVGPGGLLSTASRVDLLSVAINAQGDVRGKTINAIAGSNDIAYDTLAHIPAALSAGAIDIARLGGMYANQISLVANTDGIGVNVEGSLVSAGNIVITSTGKLINAGSLSAQADARLNTAATVNNGAIVAGQTLALAGSSLENTGNISSGKLELSSRRALNLGSGVIASQAGATVTGDTLNNLGRIDLGGLAAFNVRRLNNPGRIDARGGLTAAELWQFDNAGVFAGSDISLSLQALNNPGRIEAQSLSVGAIEPTAIPVADRLTGSLIDNSGLLAADRIALTGFTQIRNSNRISTDVTWAGTPGERGQINLKAGTLDNRGGSLFATGSLELAATDIANQRGSIASTGNMHVTADRDLDNRAGLILHQGSGTATITAGRALGNAQGQIEGQGTKLAVTAGDLDNSEGRVLQTRLATASDAPGELDIRVVATAESAGQLRNVKGEINGSGNVRIEAAKLITDPSDPALSSGSSLNFLDKNTAQSGNVSSGTGYNWESDIQAAAAVTAAKANANQAAANLTAAQNQLTSAQASKQTADANLQAAASTKSSADALAASTAAAAAADPASTDKALAAANARAAANTAATNYSTAQTAASIAASNQDSAENAVNNAAAANTSAQAAYAAALAAVPPVETGNFGSAGAQPGNQPADLTVPNPPAIVLSVPESRIQAGKHLDAIISGTLDNRKGKLAAGGNLNVVTGGNLFAGQVEAADTLSLTSNAIVVDEQILARQTTLNASQVNVTGRVQGNEQLTIQSDSLTNSGTLTGNATRLEGRRSPQSLVLANSGLIQGNLSLEIEAEQLLNAATLASGGDLALTAARQLENRALIFSTGAQKIQGADIVNNEGRFYAMGDLLIQGSGPGAAADSLLNYAGRIESLGEVMIKAHSVINRAVLPSVNQRALVSRSDDGVTILTRASDTFNADGKKAEILAGKNLTIESDSLANEYGILSARLNAWLKTRTLTNRAYGAIQTENVVVRAACFNCHQTVRYADTWGGVIESGRTMTINADVIDHQTTDTRDGFAGLKTDPRAILVDERAGTSPLTQAFKERFGVVNGPTNSTGGSVPIVTPASPRRLSNNLVLTQDGRLDFSQYKLPDGKTSLFETATADAPYLVQGRSGLYTPASNGQYTDQNRFLGSDYLLQRLGMLPTVAKRLGDAWYETQLIQDQLFALTGRHTLLTGTDTDYDLMRGLMDAGVLAQARFGLAVGQPLSPEQQAALTQPLLWPEWQEVNGQKVLVPKLYLAHQDTPAPQGALIAGKDVAITTRELKSSGALLADDNLSVNAAGTVSGGGSYRGGKSVALLADAIDLKNARLDSGGWLNLASVGDTTLTATQLKAAGNASVSAGGDLKLLAEEHTANVTRGDGTSRHQTQFETSNITAGGDLNLQAGHHLAAQGSQLAAGGDASLQAGQQLDLTAVTNTDDYSYRGRGALLDPQRNGGTPGASASKAGGLFGRLSGKANALTEIHDSTPQAVTVTAGKDLTLNAEAAQLNGTTLNAQNIGIAAAQTLAVSDSQVTAQNQLQLAGNDIAVQRSALKSGGDTTLNAADNLTLKSSQLQAGSHTALNAGGQIALQGEAGHPTRISGQQVDIVGLGGIRGEGVDIQAQQDLNLASLGDITLTGTQTATGEGGDHIRRTTEKSTLAGEAVRINALNQGNLTLQATDVTAKKEAQLSAGGDVTLLSGENYRYDRNVSSSTSSSMLGFNKKTTTTVTIDERTEQVASVVSGGESVTISAGKDLDTIASQVQSGGDVTLTAEGDINYYAAQNLARHEVNSKTTSSFIGIKYGGSKTNDSVTQRTAAPTQLQSEADILSQSGGDTRLQGTEIKAGGRFTAQAGVGPKADPDAQILIEGVKEVSERIHTEKDDGLLWQKQAGQGDTKETLKLAKIDAKDIQFIAPGGLQVQLPAGDPIRTQVDTLSQQPGMEWLKQVSQRQDVNWAQVKLAVDHWDYSHEGLSQVGALIIAIAVAVVAGPLVGQALGAAAEGAAAASISEGLAAGTITTSAEAASIMSSAQLAATMGSAGLTSLTSTAAVSLINNKGDIGKTLKDLGSNENLKNLATSMATAGALEYANPGWASQLKTADIDQKAVINLTNAAVSATVKTAIQGGSYEQNLQASLLAAGIDTAAGWAANQIGNGVKNCEGPLSELQGQYLAHKVAHALLGCAGASAKGQDCASGAIGGAVGETFAEFYAGTNDGSTLTPEKQNEVLQVSKLVAAAAAGIAGKDASAAVSAAELAVLNNELMRYKLKGMGAAYVDDQFATKLDKWIQLAKSQGVDLNFNEAFRTTDYQSGLVNNPNAITPAKAGSSLHEAGFAVDVNFSSLKDFPGGLTGDQQRRIILDSAKEAGLSWGGNFSKPDYPHFYYDPGGRTQKIVDAQRAYCDLSGRCK